jgi:hypothetical protein
VGGRAWTRIAAAVFVLGGCSSGHGAVTTTTTPGPVVPNTPLLRPVVSKSHAPCGSGAVPGYGPQLDGTCFRLGAPLATTSDVSSYGVSCLEPSTGWTLELSFTRSEGTRLAAYTRAHTRATAAIVEDGVVVFSGPMNGQLGGSVEITGENFHASELRRIGARSGAREQRHSSGIDLPFPVPPGSTIIVRPTTAPTGTQPPIGRCKTNAD